MAWTKEARAKAAETRKKNGIHNQYSKGKTISEETRQKLKVSSTGKLHSQETKELISEKARASKHRRVLRSTRWYLKKDGTKVRLDSSWEELLAKRLDELEVRWETPSPIEWYDRDGKKHNYFADFYLPEYDLLLDPKNPAVLELQAEKIAILEATLNNLLILKSVEEIKNFAPVLATPSKR